MLLLRAPGQPWLAQSRKPYKVEVRSHSARLEENLILQLGIYKVDRSYITMGGVTAYLTPPCPRKWWPRKFSRRPGQNVNIQRGVPIRKSGVSKEVLGLGGQTFLWALDGGGAAIGKLVRAPAACTHTNDSPVLAPLNWPKLRGSGPPWTFLCMGCPRKFRAGHSSNALSVLALPLRKSMVSKKVSCYAGKTFLVAGGRPLSCTRGR